MIDEYSASCPDEVSIVALMMTAPNGEPAVAVGLCYSGPLDRGESVLAPLLRSGPMIANLIKVQPYTSVQTMFDVAWPAGRRYYSKSSIVRRLSDEMIDCLLDCSRTLPTNLSSIAMQQLHGAASRVGATDTVFPHRFDHFSVYVHPATDEPAEAQKIVDWGREKWQLLQPYMDQAVYVNGIEDALAEGQERLQEAYGLNYQRLMALKKRYDPDNFLSANQNIRA